MCTKRLNIKFYQNIAKVFYAVANADGVIRESEIKRLKNIVKKEWLLIDDTEDDFYTDAAYQIEIVFDWLQSKNANTKACYEEFIDYFDSNPHFFTDKIKHLILETSGKIASAFAGKNKSELIVLGNLTLTFKKEMKIDTVLKSELPTFFWRNS